MKYDLYSPPKVPDRTWEVIVLFFFAMMCGMWALIAYEIWLLGKSVLYLIDPAVPVAIPAGIWALLRMRRRRAMQRREAFYEGLRKGLENP